MIYIKIDKLELKNFGKFNNLTLELSRDLNIIYGENEAGKTTVQWFIKGMLFGLKGGKAARSGELSPLKRFKPWNGNDYNGFISYSLDNGTVFRIGRNFASNATSVFDSLFNNITPTFEVCREKGVQFAERHLGLNETCFDKTVFIRQMDLKVDGDGSRELIERLANVGQTGFEDVSLRKAQEALKEALKNHVGTDKTTTRPLDRVIARLEELRALKSHLTDRRNSLLEIERELGSALTEHHNLEVKKGILVKVKELFELRENMDELTRRKLQLIEMRDTIKSIQEEIYTIDDRIREIEAIREEFIGFSRYESEDVDRLNLEYYRLINIEEENGKLEKELVSKKAEVERIQGEIAPLKAFGSMDGGADLNALVLSRDIDILKSSNKTNSLIVLDRQIKAMKRWIGLTLGGTGLCVLLLVSSLALGISKSTGSLKLPALAGIPLFGVLTVILLFILRILSRDLGGLKKEKNHLGSAAGSMADEISRKENALKSMLESVGAGNVEELIKLKALFDGKTRQLAALNADVSRLESEIESNTQRVLVLKSSIHDKLFEAGIISCDQLAAAQPEGTGNPEQFNGDHINRFKYGVRRYKGIEPSSNYAVQRLTDLKANLLNICGKAAPACGLEFDEGTFSGDYVEKIAAGLDSLIKELDVSLDSMMQVYSQKSRDADSYVHNEQYKELWALKSRDIVELQYSKTVDELNGVVLKIKEYETTLNNLSVGEEEIQKTDEEIEELEARKSRLEDTNISLRIACDILTEAGNEIQRNFAPALNNLMTAIIGRISGGRYENLKADDDFSLKVMAPETGDIVSALVLSGGTIDQIYLALRISMAKLISRNREKLPFLMDEVFAQYDDTRAGNTFAFLNDLALENQILFFTCKRREVELAREVCGDGVNIIRLA